MKRKKRHLQLIVSTVTIITCGLLVWRVAYLTSPPSAPAVPVYQPRLELYNYTHPMHQLAAKDYHSLVNYIGFNFSILHRGCSDRSFLLVLVHSSPGNYRKRRVIRSTWGRNNCSEIRLYFLMGRSSNSTIRESILEEDETHGDLIQGSFLDRYRNLTYKHVMSLKYAVYHCPQAKYVLKTDDDVFVNVPLLKRFLQVDLSPFGTSALLYCSVKKSATVLRTYRSKWRVGFEEYPFRTYPDYCPGWAILYSPDVVFALYKSAQNMSEVFWIDDVLITGILARKNNLTHTDSTDTVISEEDQIRLVRELEMPDKPFMFGRPDLSGKEIERLWLGVNKEL